jgi:hypothetical protein
MLPTGEYGSSTFVMLNDVTARKRVEEALGKAHDELEEPLKKGLLNW